MTAQIQNMIQTLCGLGVRTITNMANDLLFDIAFESYTTEDVVDPQHVDDHNMDVYCEIDTGLINVGCPRPALINDYYARFLSHKRHIKYFDRKHHLC